MKFEYVAGIETQARVFYMQFAIDDHQLDVTVVFENARGHLSVHSGELDCGIEWPDSTRWGTPTFEEFLMARPNEWIAYRMLRGNSCVVDAGTTCRALATQFPDAISDIADLAVTLEDIGLAALDLDLNCLRGSLGDVDIRDFIIMKPTPFMKLLIHHVLPKLKEELKTSFKPDLRLS